MRLIDADALIEELHHIIEGDADLRKDYEYMGIDDCIRSMPTAYSVDAVVKQLEERINNRDCKYCKYNKIEKQVCTKDCTDALIEDLLDIVRKGGVE